MRIVLHLRTLHWNVVDSGIRAAGNGRRHKRSSVSRDAAGRFRSSSTTARTKHRYADSSTKSLSPRNVESTTGAVAVGGWGVFVYRVIR